MAFLCVEEQLEGLSSSSRWRTQQESPLICKMRKTSFLFFKIVKKMKEIPVLQFWVHCEGLWSWSCQGQDDDLWLYTDQSNEMKCFALFHRRTVSMWWYCSNVQNTENLQSRCYWEGSSPSESQGCGELGIAVHRKWHCGFQIKGRNNAVCDSQACYRLSGRSSNMTGYIPILVHSKDLATALPTIY